MSHGRGLCVFSGKLHWHFALLIWVLFQCQLDVWLNPIPFLIGSIFPDCDIKQSMMGKLLPLWLFFNHRGFTHTLPAIVLFASPIAYFNMKWGLLFAAGYLLHLAMDDSTPMRVKWLRGHKRRKKRFLT